MYNFYNFYPPASEGIREVANFIKKKTHIHPNTVSKIFTVFKGAIIRGWGTFSTFKVINLTYHARTMFIEFALHMYAAMSAFLYAECSS